ncbi:hypothetical protein HGM15179_011714 [Zosterops borbonicus]|uniref:Uncharacterized protein n=1 Tax=Zosterops borbonicus TaxID=364589 RepID=A0A8K1GCQ7_9PASS|nr:hypothetical protein HGM15179_011714 [Zosterops borbonicus]
MLERDHDPHRKTMLEQASVKTCGPIETGAHIEAGLLAGLVTPWETHTGAVCAWRVHPMEGTQTGAVCEELWEGLTLDNWDLSPMRRAPHWSKGRNDGDNLRGRNDRYNL